MSFNPIQDQRFYQSVVKKKKIAGADYYPRRKPKSDLQAMLENEKKQHEQQYIYQHGHN
jgi:hypothetical protein